MYATPNVVKLMCIPLFQFRMCYHDGVRVNDTVHLLYMLIFKSCL